MQVYADSETAPLQAVLLGFMDDFRIGNPVNNVQRYYYPSDPPRHELLVRQYENLAAVLENQGVQVYRYDRKPGNMNRPFARDALMVIHDTLFICSMKNRPAPDITDLSSQIENPVIKVDRGIVEGGDVILDKDTLYIGMGERTESKGLEWLREKLGNRFEIQPLRLRHDCLHLDVVFNIVGRQIALIYPPAFEEAALTLLKKRYRLFEITEAEQFSLGTNLISLTPETVISEKRTSRINDFLKKEGIEVIAVDYSEVSKLGGSFRCSTCPLIRGSG